MIIVLTLSAQSDTNLVFDYIALETIHGHYFITIILKLNKMILISF